MLWLKFMRFRKRRASRGRSIVNLLEKEKEENISAFVAVKEFRDDQYLVMATEQGTIKKTVLSAYSNVRKGGIIAINLNAGDRLIEVKKTEGNNDLVLGTRNGMAIRFNEKDVRDMGRNS